MSGNDWDTGDAWVVVSTTETDDETGEKLYWSNEDGWVSLDTATVFTTGEALNLNPPLDGKYVIDTRTA